MATVLWTEIRLRLCVIPKAVCTVLIYLLQDIERRQFPLCLELAIPKRTDSFASNISKPLGQWFDWDFGWLCYRHSSHNLAEVIDGTVYMIVNSQGGQTHRILAWARLPRSYHQGVTK